MRDVVEQINDLAQDKKRMDWLSSHAVQANWSPSSSHHVRWSGFARYGNSFREALDNLIKAVADNENKSQ